MRIGIVVDGDAELRSLPLLAPRLLIGSNSVGKVLLAQLHPHAPSGNVARIALKSVLILAARGHDKVIVLIDQDDCALCPVARAGQIALELRDRIAGLCNVSIEVVVKTKSFESWLLSDPDALVALSGRFRLSAADVRAIAPNKVDQTDASRLMRKVIIGGYDKVGDAARIMGRVDIGRSAKNSRSFRRFLRVIGDTRYSAQSARP